MWIEITELQNSGDINTSDCLCSHVIYTQNQRYDYDSK